MTPDKFSAVWLSHSSISDFLSCPRSYFLKNVYKDTRTGHKIQIISPPLVLGQVVHEVIEALSVLPVAVRFSTSIFDRFETAWQKLSGEKGGFSGVSQEDQYKKRGREMLEKVITAPGPLKNTAVKIKSDLPFFWLSETDNIILCGKIDWLEYLPASNSVHIIDFKTSRQEVDAGSLQLPIYLLLATRVQNRPVTKASYWYLENSPLPQEQTLPDANPAEEKIVKIGKDVKLARQLGRFKCPEGERGCRYCRPFERLLKGEGHFVGLDHHRRDIYTLAKLPEEEQAILL